MRLLDTETGQYRFVLTPFDVPYAILSHTWDSGGEQSFQDVCNIQASAWKGGPLKTLLFWLGHLLRRITSPQATGNRETCGRWTHARRRLVSQLLSWIGRLLTIVRKIAFRSPSILSDPRISAKIRNSCAVARTSGYQYLWIDACCIDKSSSAELSEALNSMYDWYQHAAICFAYLCDVDDGEDPEEEDSTFRSSRWFTRGWTLQELIAPPVVVFLSRQWSPIGTKATLGMTIFQITTIPWHFLTHELPLIIAGVAQRFCWAASRTTTYDEDEAYCLMGLFGINMPILYGEGRYAFIRLQEHILRDSVYDQSLFGWCRNQFIGPAGDATAPRLQHLRRSPQKAIYTGSISATRDGAPPYMADAKHVFATCPGDFGHCWGTAGVHPQVFEEFLGMSLPIPTYTPTSFGMRTQLPMFPIDVESEPVDAEPAEAERPCQWYIAILACQDKTRGYRGTNLLGMICSLPVRRGDDEEESEGDYEERYEDAVPILFGGSHVGARSEYASVAIPMTAFRCVVLSTDDLNTVRSSIRIMDVFIPMRPQQSILSATHRYQRVSSTLRYPDGGATLVAASVELAQWSLAFLAVRQYTVTTSPFDRPYGPKGQRGCALALTRDGVTIDLNYLPRPTFGPQGAAVWVRLPLFSCADDLEGVQGPILIWQEWRLVAEAGPAVINCTDSRCDVRGVRLTLTYHALDEYLLGIEIMGSDVEERQSLKEIFRYGLQIGALAMPPQDSGADGDGEASTLDSTLASGEDREEDLDFAGLDGDVEEEVRRAMRAVTRALLSSLSS